MTKDPTTSKKREQELKTFIDQETINIRRESNRGIPQETIDNNLSKNLIDQITEMLPNDDQKKIDQQTKTMILSSITDTFKKKYKNDKIKILTCISKLCDEFSAILFSEEGKTTIKYVKEATLALNHDLELENHTHKSIAHQTPKTPMVEKYAHLKNEQSMSFVDKIIQQRHMAGITTKEQQTQKATPEEIRQQIKKERSQGFDKSH